MNLRKISSLYAVLASGFIACNPVTDRQPAPLDGVSPDAIRAVTSRFPQAKEMIFAALEKDKVWQVNFSQQQARYRAVTNQQTVLLADQLATQTVPDSLASLVNNTVIQGGTFTDLRAETYLWYRDSSSADRFVYADYTWQGTPYTVRWTITNIKGNITYVLEMMPYYQFEYRTVSQLDLPTSIQQSIGEQLTSFDHAMVRVDGQGKKRYSIAGQQKTSFVNLTYDDTGTLISNSGTQQRLTSIGQLPVGIQTYIRDAPELADFGLAGQFAGIMKSANNGIDTYSVVLQKGRQTWFLVFSSEGQLLSRSYLNLV